MITPYVKKHEASLIDAYITTFAAEPWNELWDHDWVKERLRWVESVPSFKGYIALQNERAVGALLGFAKPFKGRLDFEILELFVHPEYQGKGFGRRLIRHLERELDKDSYGVVHLLTGRNTRSEDFYRRQNYERSDSLCFMVHRL